jgi:hypothetical protein
MKKITFKCKLLSDIIINRKSATVGNQLTLDFIPGNNFYGIVANKLYKDNSVSDDERYKVLHSGKVRFGDAHPSQGDDRALHVPAAMFYPKLAGIESTYINHAITDALNENKIVRAELNKLQLKQCRSGFYIFNGKKGLPVEVAKTFSLKSAYDREQRRSQDSQMFGYESINKGLEMIFYVYVDDDVTTDVAKLLVGTQRVGRSRTAQYGLVEITEIGKPTEQRATTINQDKEFYVYADSRLILKDEYGNASADARYMFNSDECELILGKTQVRLFQYSPWNYKRQSHDTDRYGIEKGSVIAFKAKKTFTSNHFVGLYQAEGFGHILVNPDFLKAEEIKEENNELQPNALYKLQKPDGTQKAGNAKSETESNNDNDGNYKLELIDTSALEGLVLNLAYKANDERCRQYLYNKVGDFVTHNSDKFKKDGKKFASQWGNIRDIAATSKDAASLEAALYGGNSGYLTHGVAKEKWAEQGRLGALQRFIRTAKDQFEVQEKNFKVQDEKSKEKVYANRYVPMAVVNLASEMAKKCNNK